MPVSHRKKGQTALLIKHTGMVRWRPRGKSREGWGGNSGSGFLTLKSKHKNLTQFKHNPNGKIWKKRNKSEIEKASYDKV